MRAVPSVDRSELPPIEHRPRVRAVQAMVAAGDHRCDAILLTDLTDIRWLTGFTGSNGWVVVRGDDLVLGTDGRYGERAQAETAGSGATVVAEPSRPRLHDRLVATLAGASRVGLDPSTISHAAWTRLAGDLELESLDSFVGVERQRKDAAEVARIAAAAAAADAALAEVEPLLRAAGDSPVTEADVRDELEHRMRRHGADDRSYDTIVATGPDHAARPHHEASRRRIVEGDTVVIDVGALVDGYHSDMTRSYVIGDPTAEQREVYDLVDRAQRAGVAAVTPGVAARDVDAASRDVFEEAGLGGWYPHGTGHGVGLEIHERPFHSSTSEDVIREGYVVTVEPGLYRVGFGGFRIEDLVVVTGDGCRPLTHAPKRPWPPN